MILISVDDNHRSQLNEMSLDKYTIRKYQARTHLKNDDFKGKKKKTETNANNDVLAK